MLRLALFLPSLAPLLYTWTLDPESLRYLTYERGLDPQGLTSRLGLLLWPVHTPPALPSFCHCH